MQLHPQENVTETFLVMHEHKKIYHVCCIRITQLMFHCRVTLYTLMFTAPLHYFVASTYSTELRETHQTPILFKANTHLQVQQQN